MPSSVKRNGERLMFLFDTHDTLTTVKRSTFKSAAKRMGVDETALLHLAAAQFLRSLPSAGNSPFGPPDDGRLTVAQLDAIRAMVPQEFSPTHSFIGLFDK